LIDRISFSVRFTLLPDARRTGAARTDPPPTIYSLPPLFSAAVFPYNFFLGQRHPFGVPGNRCDLQLFTGPRIRLPPVNDPPKAAVFFSHVFPRAVSAPFPWEDLAVSGYFSARPGLSPPSRLHSFSAARCGRGGVPLDVAPREIRGPSTTSRFLSFPCTPSSNARAIFMTPLRGGAPFDAHFQLFSLFFRNLPPWRDCGPKRRFSFRETSLSRTYSFPPEYPPPGASSSMQKRPCPQARSLVQIGFRRLLSLPMFFSGKECAV